MSDYASCCVLSYNRLELLLPSLETMILNAGAPFELIVHDDGSKVGPLQEYLVKQLNNGRISSLILNPPGHNQGQGTALNRMFRMATGDPIIKLDHDLLYTPDWLAKVQAILSSNRMRDRIPRALAHQYTPEPLIGLLGLLHYYHHPVHSLKTKIADHYLWSEHTHILGSAFAVTRHCWTKLGPFEEHSTAFAEDWVFQRRVTDSSGDPKAYHDGHEKGIGPKGFVCGLPEHDLVTNEGMGYGPSTVNVAPEVVQSIKLDPYILGAS